MGAIPAHYPLNELARHVGIIAVIQELQDALLIIIPTYIRVEFIKEF